MKEERTAPGQAVRDAQHKRVEEKPPRDAFRRGKRGEVQSPSWEERVLSARLFAGLDPDAVRRFVLPCGHLKTYRRGEMVYIKQDRVERLEILLSGRVHLLHIFESGAQSIISVLQAGDTLGLELIFTSSRVAPYYAQAQEETVSFSLPRSVFGEQSPLPVLLRCFLMERILKMVSHDNIRKEYRLAILSQNGLRDRIWTYLSMQADKRGSDTVIIPFSREEMASFLCVNRSALSHELSLMRRDGILDFKRTKFVLFRGKTGYFH